MPNPPAARSLPEMPQPLLGRQIEIQQAWELLQSHRLVTFTGPAGVGKTFLALHLARTHVIDFPGGVFFVRLQSDPLPLNAIARAVKADNNPDQTLSQSICTRLSNGPSLLVLDGATLAHTAQEFLAPLLEGAPQMHALLTADELLYLPGEQIVVVPPLALPMPGPRPPSETLLEYLQRIPAVSLFVQFAQAADPNFCLEQAQAESMVTLCSLVGGLPLGLKLAAVQCNRMPLEQIISGLQAARRSGAKTDDASTMQNVLDWSVGLLDESTRQILLHAAVFNGNFDLEAAQAICAAEQASVEGVAASLSVLQASALLRTEPVPATETPRYHLPAAVRAYALQALEHTDRAEALRHQHALYYASLAEKADAGLKGPEQPKFLNLLETEYPNLIAAIYWASQPAHAELALRLAGNLIVFWIIRSNFRDGLTCLEPALEYAHNASDAVCAKAFNGAGVMASGLGHYESARVYFHQALARARIGKDQAMAARVLNNLGIIAGDRAEYSQARRFFAEALEIQQQIGDDWGACNVMMNLGIVENHRGEPALARQHFEECLVFARQMGVQNLIALNLDNLGEALLNLDDLDMARSSFQESYRLAHELEDQESTANALGGLGKVAFYQGRLDEALGFFEQASAVLSSIGHQAGLAGTLHWQGATYCMQGNQPAAAQALLTSLNRGSTLGLRKEVCQTLVCLARLALLRQAPACAARLLGAAEHLRQEIEFVYGLPEQRLRQSIEEEITSQLGEDAWQTAWGEGLALTFKQAVALGQQCAAPSETDQKASA